MSENKIADALPCCDGGEAHWDVTTEWRTHVKLEEHCRPRRHDRASEFPTHYTGRRPPRVSDVFMFVTAIVPHLEHARCGHRACA